MFWLLLLAVVVVVVVDDDGDDNDDDDGFLDHCFRKRSRETEAKAAAAFGRPMYCYRVSPYYVCCAIIILHFYGVCLSSANTATYSRTASCRVWAAKQQLSYS